MPFSYFLDSWRNILQPCVPIFSRWESNEEPGDKRVARISIPVGCCVYPDSKILCLMLRALGDLQVLNLISKIKREWTFAKQVNKLSSLLWPDGGETTKLREQSHHVHRFLSSWFSFCLTEILVSSFKSVRNKTRNRMEFLQSVSSRIIPHRDVSPPQVISCTTQTSRSSTAPIDLENWPGGKE